MIQFDYDREGDVFEIRFSTEKVVTSEYLEETGIVVDYNTDHHIISMEITSFSKRVSKSESIDSIAV